MPVVRSHARYVRVAVPNQSRHIYLVTNRHGQHRLITVAHLAISGEMYGIRMDRSTSPELRTAVTPRTQADKPVGEWNRYEITVRGNTVTVVLNDKTVIPGAQIPGLPARGRIGLQHHGGKRDGKWNSPPSLLQFKNVFIKELEK